MVARIFAQSLGHHRRSPSPSRAFFAADGFIRLKGLSRCVYPPCCRTLCFRNTKPIFLLQPDLPVITASVNIARSITDTAISAAGDWSVFAGFRLPDKAMDLLDTSCAQVRCLTCSGSRLPGAADEISPGMAASKAKCWRIRNFLLRAFCYPSVIFPLSAAAALARASSAFSAISSTVFAVMRAAPLVSLRRTRVPLCS